MTQNTGTPPKSTILTGIKPTGVPHLGNYYGALEPALRRASEYDNAYFFIADYHALNSIQSADQLKELTRTIAATWLAAGLDPKKVHFYRQSDIPEIFELMTILNAFIPKGWMNKMHAYKAAVDKNRQNGKTDDDNINMGLYTYPILMACDILLFNTEFVPVGRDQIQHVEIARDIAQRFNNHYGSDVLTLPEYLLEESVQEIPGIDQRKMSKSYDNTIPLFATREEWEAAARRIITDNLTHTNETLQQTAIYQIFATIAPADQVAQLERDILAGDIGWKVAKERLVEALESRFGEASQHYRDLMANPDFIDATLREGAASVRPEAQATLHRIKSTIGLV